ncbi:hypothetical protein H0H93_015300, partial [Arthromyces matolae]
MGRLPAYKTKAKLAAEKEAAIQKAVYGYQDGTYKSFSEAASALGLETSRTTIWRRYANKSKPHTAAHLTQQLLNENQEIVLQNWIKWLGITGVPLSKKTIGPKVKALCGKTPSCRWILRFLARHPECTLGKPAGLDRKRARAFNFTT